jgi:YD repeat-containing protein
LGRLNQATQPESGTINYGYDENGNLTSRTDARSILTTISYDMINRRNVTTYSDGTPQVTHTWDTSFPLRLNSVYNLASSSIYSQHDIFDRPKQSRQITLGQTYWFQYTYNRKGDLATQTYPSGRVISFTPDNAGRLKTVSGVKDGIGVNYSENIQYASHGGISQTPLGNGLIETLRHNSRLQPDRVQLGTASSPSQRAQLEFFYCPGSTLSCSTNNGNVVEQRINPLSVTQYYYYDGVNRLGSSSESNWFQTYSYDQWGNRAVTGGYVPAGSSLTPTTLNYVNNLWNVAGVHHDAAGNQDQLTILRSMAYDAENRMKWATVNSVFTIYEYDGDGRRVQKGTGGVTRLYARRKSIALRCRYQPNWLDLSYNPVLHRCPSFTYILSLHPED